LRGFIVGVYVTSWTEHRNRILTTLFPRSATAMPAQVEAFVQFLRKLTPLMESPPLYRSLEFGCVAIKHTTQWVVASGKGLLSTQSPPPDRAEVTPWADLDRLVAFSWRTQVESLNNLLDHLAEGWVLDAAQQGRILLSAPGMSAYSWQMPAVYSPDTSWIPSSQWKRFFALYGRGSDLSTSLDYAAWEEIEAGLRKKEIASGFDGLCAKLGLAARRASLGSTFYLAAELPARFTSVQMETGGNTLEGNFEYVGRPSMEIEWLPQHDFKRIPESWQHSSDRATHHFSIPLDERADKVELRLSFADIDAADTHVHTLKRKEVATPPPKQSAAKVSSIIEGRWRRVRSLPEGGQGHLFIVEDTTGEFAGQLVQKRLKNVDDQDRRKRFEDEVAVVRSLDHPNVLRVMYSDLTAERPYFIAEFCERGSLQETGALRFMGNIQTTAATLLPIIDALVAAHNAGVIHRDVKPANILIRKDGTAVIGDFGICFKEGERHLTLSNEGMGSRNFIAPEMESGQHHLGNPSELTDVYSLGKVIYWMLSGGKEFAREEFRPLADLLKDQRLGHVDALLTQMVVREPAKRLRSQDVREKLQVTVSLVEDGAALLAPSTGIVCRFCGLGKYQRFAAYDAGDPSKSTAYPEGTSQLGLYPVAPSTNIRCLRCPHCGHIEWFQFGGIENPSWWEK